MALDMESEFYKLAHNILSKPQNLYKMAAVSPNDGRLSLMGAEGYLVVPKTLIQSVSKMTEDRAYSLGRSCGEELFGGLIKEFDEEIETLPPAKLMELGMLLSRTLGWGIFEVANLKYRTGEVEVRGERTVEQNYKKAKHHMVTTGFLAGILTKSMKREMAGEFKGVVGGKAVFAFKPVQA